MSKRNRRSETAEAVSGAPRAFYFSVAAAAWATLLCAVYVYYYCRKVPLMPVDFLKWLEVELVVGPEFLGFWARHLLTLGKCGLFLLGAWGVGDVAVRRIFDSGPDSRLKAFYPVFSMGLGFGILGYLAFALLALGAIQQGLLIALYVALAVLGARQACGWWKVSRGSRRMSSTPTSLEKTIFAFLFVLLVLELIVSTIPETSFDALTYHLAVPQAYLFSGRMIDLPHNHFSYLPLLSSMLYFWGLALGGAFLAKAISMAVGCCLLGALYAYGKFWGNRSAGLLACLIFLGTPLTMYLFLVCNSDFCAAFFLFLAFVAIHAAFSREDGTGTARKLLPLAGLFCGLAAACKYTASFGILVLAFMVAVAFWRDRERIGIRGLVLFGLFLMLPLLPWWGRNYKYTGNPFFPYLSGTLGPKSTDEALMQDWKNETRDASPGFRPDKHVEKLWDDATRGFINASYDFSGPVFLGFFPLTLLGLGAAWTAEAAVFSSVSLMLGLSATYITRLLFWGYVPLCAAIAFAVLSPALKRGLRRWMAALILFTVALNAYFFYSFIFFTSYLGLRVAMGRMAPAEYLRSPRNLYPVPPYGAYEFIAGLKLAPQDRVVEVGEPRSFYSPVLAVTNAQHDPPVLFSWAGESKNAEELYERIRKNGIKLILVSPVGSAHIDDQRYATQDRVALIGDMLDRYFDVVYQDKFTRVYRFKPTTTASPAPLRP